MSDRPAPDSGREVEPLTVSRTPPAHLGPWADRSAKDAVQGLQDVAKRVEVTASILDRSIWEHEPGST